MVDFVPTEVATRDTALELVEASIALSSEDSAGESEVARAGVGGRDGVWGVAAVVIVVVVVVVVVVVAGEFG